MQGNDKPARSEQLGVSLRDTSTSGLPDHHIQGFVLHHQRLDVPSAHHTLEHLQEGVHLGAVDGNGASVHTQHRRYYIIK